MAKAASTSSDASAAKPVYALIGSDPYLQTERLSDVLSRLPRDLQRIDLEGEKATLADVLDELRSFAMFGGGKLVVLRDADAFVTRFREQVETYLESPSSSGTLIFRFNTLPANQRVYKLIQKVGAIEKIESPKPADLPRWITAHAKNAHGVAILPDAAQALAEMIGDDLGRLDNEIAKLALQSDTGKIEVKDVEKGVAFQREQQMWDMTNQIAAGYPDEALRRWRHLVQLDSSAEFRAVTWLGMWLERAQQAVLMRKKGMNAFSIGSALKIWPRELQEPFVKTADRLGQVGVSRALDLLVEIDHQSKSGVGNAADNIERFLLTVGESLR